MSNAKITLYSFYRWFKDVDEDLFSEMELPESINRERLINTLLLRGGEFEVQFDSADMVRFQLGVITRNWYDTFNRWAEALAVEYAPLENYDRIEDWTDDTSGTSRSDASGSDYRNGNTTKSAYNSNSLVVDTGDSDNGSSETHATGSASSNSKHSGRVHGNIGVTTSSKMLDEFMKVRADWGNLYNHVADIILRDIVIPIY